VGERVAGVRSDWQGLGLTLALPLLVAASFVWLGLRPQWEEDAGDWATGMLVLLPLEFIRIIVLWILRDTYADYRSPAHALRFFLLSIGILALLCLGFALLQFGVRATIAALAQADTWRMLLPPAALIVADGVIGLYFFRGDARVQAARLEAQGDDAQDWLASPSMRCRSPCCCRASSSSCAATTAPGCRRGCHAAATHIVPWAC
jgi:hypothetical protein